MITVQALPATQALRVPVTESQIKEFVAGLFKDGKSPLTTFGTSWEQLEILERNIEKKMTLFDEVKSAQLRFRKEAVKGSETAKVYVKLFTTLIGESQVDGKDPSDEHLIKVIQKFVKNANEVLKVRPGDIEAGLEVEALKQFLPTMITTEQIYEAIKGSEDLNKGAKIGLVKLYCAEHNVLFDGKLVSSLV